MEQTTIEVTLYSRENTVIRKMGNSGFDILQGRMSGHGLELLGELTPKGDFLSMLALSRVFAGRVASRLPGRRGTARVLSLKERKRIFFTLVGRDVAEIEISVKEYNLNFRFPVRYSNQQFDPHWYPFTFVAQVIRDNQYTVSREVLKDRIVVDAGANIGVFAVFAARLGAGKVYAFEPVAEAYEELCRTIRSNGLEGTVVPVRKALGGKNEKIQMLVGDNFGGSTLEDSGSAAFDHSGLIRKEEVEVVKLDTFTDEPVGFIKMDVEGYEENVLLGAARIIRQHKPVLAFSAYHKPTDKTRLPEVLNSIRADYSCVLNQRNEEVFFCR